MIWNYIILLLVSSFLLVNADVNTMTDKIIKDILKDYNPDARPAGKIDDRTVG